MEAKEYSFVTPDRYDDYDGSCRAIGLSPVPGGWALLHCVDDDGKRWTLATSDLQYVDHDPRERPGVG